MRLRIGATDEPYGDGRVISSGPDPFDRGYTEAPSD